MTIGNMPSLAELGLTAEDLGVDQAPRFNPAQSEKRSDLQLSMERRVHIYDFCRNTGKELKKITTQNDSILILDIDKTFQLDQTKVEAILAEQKRALRENIGNECYKVAANAVDKRVALGRLSSHHGNREFVNFQNHCINYEELPDGSCLAFDLTAAQNIDRDQGNFQVLAVRADNMDTLKAQLKELYGGEEWVDTPIEEWER